MNGATKSSLVVVSQTRPYSCRSIAPDLECPLKMAPAHKSAIEHEKRALILI